MMQISRQPQPSVSFVVPAHNEEHEISGCLAAIRNAASRCNCEHEIIVVNDASTDDTARIAGAQSDRVVDVELRNIGAVRNAGAATATKSLLIFVDADTRLPAQTLREILETCSRGTLGGGASVRFDQRLDAARYLMAHSFIVLWQDILRYAAGCLVFVRRDLFERIGGFEEQYFAAEELYLSRQIKRRGKFRIVRHPVITSARKMRTYGFWEVLIIATSALLRGPRSWRSKQTLGILYDARRETDGPPLNLPEDQLDRT